MPQEPDLRNVPGVVIAHSPAVSQQYIGSPSIAILPSGEYLASHDFFGPGSTRDRTIIYASSDRGKTWQRRSEIIGQWWSTLFIHRNVLYIMGTSREDGFTVIRRSTDGGFLWTQPRDAETGLLLADGPYHCAPVPVVVHRGRIWRAMEDQFGPKGWGKCFRSFVLSAPEDADLLRAENWTLTNRIGRDPSWLGGRFGGWLEGNVVIAPDGDLVNILRVDSRDDDEWAAMIRISNDGTHAAFDPATGFFHFPGGAKKFTIRWDPLSRAYWSLATWVQPQYRSGKPASTRNTLALVRSRNLTDWEVRAVLMTHPDTEKHGFQYADWLFEGNDIVAVVRTAFDDGLGGAHNFHDANFLTFHRIANFRTLRTDVPGQR